MGASIIGRYNKPPPEGDLRIKLPRILFRLTAGAAGIVLVAFAALVLWLRYVALPNVDDYRDVIVSHIEKSSGMSIAVGAIRGGWGGLRPVVWLEGLEVSDRSGNAAFALERAEVSLSWWALAGGAVRFHDVEFYRPALDLRRGADGLIYLADKPLNATGPGGDGAFTDWLLAQPRLAIHDATLTWRDELHGAPAVRLTAVEIGVRRRRGRHQIALTARPPRDLASRVDLRADVALFRHAGRWRATGDAYAETIDADFERLRAHLPLPETLRSGAGSVRVWLQFAPGGVEEAVADINVRDARARLAEDALPLELASLSGRAVYRTSADGFTFSTEGLRFRLPSGDEARPGAFSIARTARAGATPRIEVRADGIDLKIAATLVDYFPLPRDVKRQVLRFAPRGSIAQASIAWTDDGARAYTVKGRFENLAFNAVDAVPGLTGFTGVIEGDESGGTLVVAGRGATIDMGRVLRAPLRLDTIDARASWKHEDGALRVDVTEARFANADAEGHLAAVWRALPGAAPPSPGYLELKGRLTRASAARVAHYLPNGMGETRAWLEQALQAGQSDRVDFELEGDLWEFPFGGASTGRFVVDGDLREARLRYHPEWPAVDRIEGGFRFENRRVEIRARNAAIFASRVTSAAAVIEDLGARPPLLVIDGEIDTTGADSVRFLRESPLVNGPGAFTRAIAVDGPARLKLHLDFPLWGEERARVAGQYAFAGATARVSPALAMTDLRGQLHFTERGVRAPDLTGTLFGRPATLAMATQVDGRVLTRVAGRIDARALGEHVPAALAARLSGATDWSAQIVTGGAGTRLSVASDLAGLGIDLPEPFGKAVGEARAARLVVGDLGSERELTTVSVGDRLHGRFAKVAAAGEPARWFASLKFGAPLAAEPMREGLWLFGELPFLDIDAWQAVSSDARSGAARADSPAPMTLRGIDLRLARVRYLGRDFRDLHAALTQAGDEWQGRLESPLVAGDVRWNPAGRGRLRAQLERLSVPKPAPAPPKALPAEQADLPALDVEAATFEFHGHALGQLTLKAVPQGEQWRIDHLGITAEHSTFRSSGVWRRTGTGSLTTLDVKLEARDLSALFGAFGYGEYLKRGRGELEGKLAWPGLPSEFATANLSGSLAVRARGGQFARIEAGAGKLLGLLSLQSLPRRAMLDFRDVFSDGFAFEKIDGDLKVARGVLLTDEFEISGPSAFVSLAGEVSIPEETQSLTLRVVPEVGEGIALAASVIGTPVLGLSTLIVSKLLRNPLGKAVAYEYLVTGSWDNPVVTKTSAAAAGQSAASR